MLKKWSSEEQWRNYLEKLNFFFMINDFPMKAKTCYIIISGE